MSSAPYTRSFYEDLAEGSAPSASVIVPLLLGVLPPIASVLDVGCGVGNWLEAFSRAGVTEIMGVDRDEVPDNLLRIPTDRVRRTDLSRPFDLGRKFDLVVSVEVAEHLPVASADRLVDSIAAHTDLVLFSGAVPGQGGTSHVNEQWPSYWAKRFERRGFTTLDLVRPLIWDQPGVMFWYAQNCLVYARGDSLESLAGDAPPSPRMLDVVHPALWSRPAEPLGLRGLVREVPRVARGTVDHYRRRLTEKRGQSA